MSNIKASGFKKKAVKFLLLILILSSVLVATLLSCVHQELSFEKIIISENIEENTNLPINPKTEFEITSKQIFATIKYTGAKGSDSWQFKWFNRDSGEVILDSNKKYNESQPNAYFHGIIASNIQTTEEAKIFQPAVYEVEYYHNNELKQSASFKVKKPELSIIEVSTASTIDIKGAPVIRTEQFKLNQIIYVCIKLDYLISGNTIKALWKKADDSIIQEEEIELTTDYYETSYLWFNMKLNENKGPAQPGKYKVEIYFNDNLYITSYFEVSI